jgi:hypothetical protein
LLVEQEEKDERAMEKEYRALVKAAQLLGDARVAVAREDGFGLVSPAWTMLNHAQMHLVQQADALLRGSNSCEQTSESQECEAELKEETMTA